MKWLCGAIIAALLSSGTALAGYPFEGRWTFAPKDADACTVTDEEIVIVEHARILAAEEACRIASVVLYEDVPDDIYRIESTCPGNEPQALYINMHPNNLSMRIGSGRLRPLWRCPE